MNYNRSLFTTFSSITTGSRTVKGIGTDKKPLSVLGIGDIKIKTNLNGVWKDGVIHDALFVPELGINLLSIGQTTDRGVKFVFDSLGVTLMKQEKTVATGVRIGKIYTA